MSRTLTVKNTFGNVVTITSGDDCNLENLISMLRIEYQMSNDHNLKLLFNGKMLTNELLNDVTDKSLILCLVSKSSSTSTKN